MVAREGDMMLTVGEPLWGDAHGYVRYRKRAREGDTPSAWRIALAGSNMLGISNPEHRPRGL